MDCHMNLVSPVLQGFVVKQPNRWFQNVPFVNTATPGQIRKSPILSVVKWVVQLKPRTSSYSAVSLGVSFSLWCWQSTASQIISDWKFEVPVVLALRFHWPDLNWDWGLQSRSHNCTLLERILKLNWHLKTSQSHFLETFHYFPLVSGHRKQWRKPRLFRYVWVGFRGWTPFRSRYSHLTVRPKSPKSGKSTPWFFPGEIGPRKVICYSIRPRIIRVLLRISHV